MMDDKKKGHLLEEYKKFLVLYNEIKELVFACENLSDDRKFPASALSEIGMAWSHIARVHSLEYGVLTEKAVIPKGKTASFYCETNFSKGMGHLWRGGCDCYAIITREYKSRIIKVNKAFSLYTQFAVISHLSEKRKKFNATQIMLNKAKLVKDVSGEINTETGKIEFQAYELYEKACHNLKEFSEDLENNLPLLQHYEEEAQKTKHRERRINWGVTIIIAIISILLTLALSNYSTEIFEFF